MFWRQNVGAAWVINVGLPRDLMIAIVRLLYYHYCVNVFLQNRMVYAILNLNTELLSEKCIFGIAHSACYLLKVKTKFEPSITKFIAI